MRPYLGTDKIEPILTQLILTVTGWRCVEEIKLIIQFEDKSKIEKVSWNKFNCDGAGYYELTSKEITQIKTKPILKVRITNGRNASESYTINSPDPTYFIELAAKIKAKEFTVKNN